MLLFLIIVLTICMMLDCVALVFLVLMQLPKKEAGAGLAFGGAATDALFGAGSGNFLTKATKYAGVLFFVLAIALSMLETHRANQPGSEFLQKVNQQQTQQPSLTAPPAPPAANPSASTTSSTNLILAPIETAATNAMANPASSNAAPQK
jgi:preprotein translocase subunit SecG